jgi:hypothetical protein
MQQIISAQYAVKPALADTKGPMSMAHTYVLKCHDTYTFNERISHPSHRAAERSAENAWFTEGLVTPRCVGGAWGCEVRCRRWKAVS